jgi:hypothetical protein
MSEYEALAALNITSDEIRRVEAAAASAREHYTDLDRRTASFVSTNVDALRTALRDNERWLRTDISTEQSVFVYLDISGSEEATRRWSEIRNLCNDVIGRWGFRNASMRDMHITVFTEAVADNLVVEEEAVLATFSKYRKVIEEMPPVVVHLIGPHLTPSGAVILEAEIFGEAFFALRDVARTSENNYGGQPRVPAIAYATIGYVLPMAAERVHMLATALEDFRRSARGVAVVSTRLGIVRTKNKRFMNPALLANLEGRNQGDEAMLRKRELLRIADGLSGDVRQIALQKASECDSGDFRSVGS